MTWLTQEDFDIAVRAVSEQLMDVTDVMTKLIAAYYPVSTECAKHVVAHALANVAMTAICETNATTDASAERFRVDFKTAVERLQQRESEAVDDERP